MERETVFDVPVHYTMAIFGGFIGAYAILDRMQVFGSAQTANMIELVCGILGRDPEEVLIRIGALVIFIGAIALSAVRAKNVRWNVKYLAVLFDFAAICVVGFLPA